MSIDLKIPEVGESISEALVSRWLKSEGDRVEKDEPLVELETDKVTVELPAPAAGVLTEILVENGATAAVGDVIGRLEEGADAEGEKPAQRPSRKKMQEKTAPEKAEPEKTETKKTEKAQAKRVERKRDEERPAGDEEEAEDADQAAAVVMPAAQRLLDEHRLRAEDVEATGPGGRLLKEDVQRHLEASERPAAERDGEDEPASQRQPGERREEVVPMSPIRRRIAERLVAAQQDAALLTTFNEVDMSAVIELRTRYRDEFQERWRVKLGFMSFFVRAAVDALRQFPQVNAEIRGADIIYRSYCDIGIAVSTDRGLLVPILRNAELLGFAEIESAIADFGERARSGKIKLDELEGGTFTISNGGIFGSLLSTPIVNPPQSGVLGLHAIEERPIARDGQVVIRPMMYLALSYDHRIVDGREAVTFLRRIKEAVEDPARMLLEV
ncbi:MAG TPA: 2-oxoglutarate dehydrogenase complex dihydrolipoyllysine-residue succinyltransferase [Thermoanaerobaculia bacterium]|nr:2-oxoglutarate dehydrogenase complex dihydrolipoyllysine-residue succinyltransferase [Thermoanaerobaculia bacterium]